MNDLNVIVCLIYRFTVMLGQRVNTQALITMLKQCLSMCYQYVLHLVVLWGEIVLNLT